MKELFAEVQASGYADALNEVADRAGKGGISRGRTSLRSTKPRREVAPRSTAGSARPSPRLARTV